MADLRLKLLPLDLLPSAVIDDINEKSFDLQGDAALQEDGDVVIVQQEAGAFQSDVELFSAYPSNTGASI